ncbi:MAG TPA: SCP2 sterol-binding domain-containing protein [Euzebya sp.]|nr:SCP2 sterol-binding domain-containing protein [Euzebya sp.]
MHHFPSLDWMQAYADAITQHPQAEDLASALAGRYRFVITPSGGLVAEEGYDLVVAEGPSFTAEVADAHPASLTVTADYNRWKGLLTGRADFMMSFLMRRIKVVGDVGEIRSRLSDAKPLLDCLSTVPTTFPH